MSADSKVYQNFCSNCSTLYQQEFDDNDNEVANAMKLVCPKCKNKLYVTDENRFIVYSETKNQTSKSIGAMELKNLQASATTPRMYYKQCPSCKKKDVTVCYDIHQGEDVIWTYICDECDAVWTNDM